MIDDQEILDASEKALKMLKDFQRATVENIFNNMYKDPAKKRHLVADEVGLGKTIVAKGLIGRILKQKIENKNYEKPFRIVYICSNQAIARQNLHKLNILGKERIESSGMGRLVFQALQQDDKTRFQIKALTPSTSFEVRRGSGLKKERKLIWMLLTQYKVYRDYGRSEGLKYTLLGNVTRVDRWPDEVKEYADSHHHLINNEIKIDFKKRLREQEIIFTGRDRKIKEQLNYRSHSKSIQSILLDYAERMDKFNYEQYDSCYRLLGRLRNILTDICTDYLKADLFILDEFQRFKKLIETTEDETQISEASRIAKKVFSGTQGKVLLLSATPFKAYTTSLEQELGYSHFEEFKTVLKFLSEHQSKIDVDELQHKNSILRKILRNPEELKQHIPKSAKDCKEDLEKVYRMLMSRTERVSVADDKNVLLEPKINVDNYLTESDIRHFIAIDAIQQKLEYLYPGARLRMMDYIKSAPYVFSFMEGYKNKEKLINWVEEAPSEASKFLKSYDSAWIPLDQVENYELKGEDLPNLKLRQIVNHTFENSQHKQLWLPPNLPYYTPRGAFKDSIPATKTLLFSKWRLVPRAVSAMLSYEAERRVLAKDAIYEQSHSYFQNESKSTQRSPKPILQLSNKEGRADTMRTFSLLYPSFTLSNLKWPKKGNSDKALSDLKILKEELKKEILKLIENSGLQKLANSAKHAPSGYTDPNWYWAVPLLLDRVYNPEIYESWLEQEKISNAEIFHDKDLTFDQDTSATSSHIHNLIRLYREPEEYGLGPMPEMDTLCEVMTMMALAQPANVALRLQRIYRPEIFEDGKDQLYDKVKALNRALEISFEFRTLFDKPESISVIRNYASRSELNPKENSVLNTYWFQVLQYCLDGNLQAVLDEYGHMLKAESDSLDYYCKRIRRTINIRTSLVQVDDLDSVLQHDHHKMRCHFAVPFGIQRMETETGQNRAINVVENFNSPFRPFVLASTSIGQEGLDLHYYCRRVFHWNLPYNPVDLEQREGRINRYKGQVIRQNIARSYGKTLKQKELLFKGDLWEELFNKAAAETNKQKTEMYPFWLFESDSEYEAPIPLERVVPLYPFSSDVSNYENLVSSLALYRLTFGQPRQEELVNVLNNKLDEEEIAKFRNELLINLCPIKFIPKS